MTPYEWIRLLISLFLPLSIGYALVVLLCRRLSMDMLPSLAISYGLGMGILSQWMLLLGMAQIPLNLRTIGIPLAFIAISFSVLALIKLKKNPPSADTSPSLWAADPKSPVSPSLPYMISVFIMGAYVLYNVIFVLWHSLNIPVQIWDAVATVTFKAKIFFFDRSIHQLNLPHSSYPLHVSFLQSWIALNIGRWDECVINIIFPLTFLAYLVLHYYFLRSRTDSLWAIAGTGLLLSSNFFVYHATIPYADFSLMYYNCTTILLLLVWDKQRNAALLLLAAIFSGMTTFVKLEGTIYLAVHTALLILLLKNNQEFSLKTKWNNVLLFIVPSYGISGLFHGYKKMVGVTGMEGRLEFVFNDEHAHRLPSIIENFGSNFFDPGNWSILWVLLMVGALLHFKKIKYQRDIKLLGLTMGMFFVVYVVFFILTQARIDYYSTISRVMLHFFPLITWFIILLHYQQEQTFRESQSNATPSA